MSGQVVWVVGQYKEPQWEIQAVSESEEQAISFCRDDTYFIGPMTIGELLPHETMAVWPGAYYPLANNEQSA